MPLNIVVQMKLLEKKKTEDTFISRRSSVGQMLRGWIPTLELEHLLMQHFIFTSACFKFVTCCLMFTGLYSVCLVFDHLCGGQDVYQH